MNSWKLSRTEEACRVRRRAVNELNGDKSEEGALISENLPFGFHSVLRIHQNVEYRLYSSKTLLLAIGIISQR